MIINLWPRWVEPRTQPKPHRCLCQCSTWKAVCCLWKSNIAAFPAQIVLRLINIEFWYWEGIRLLTIKLKGFSQKSLLTRKCLRVFIHHLVSLGMTEAWLKVHFSHEKLFKQLSKVRFQKFVWKTSKSDNKKFKLNLKLSCLCHLNECKNYGSEKFTF